MLTLIILCSIGIGNTWSADLTVTLDYEGTGDFPYNSDWSSGGSVSTAQHHSGSQCAQFATTADNVYITYKGNLTNVKSISLWGNRTSKNTTHPTFSVEKSTDNGSTWTKVVAASTFTLSKGTWTQKVIDIPEGDRFTGWVRLKYKCSSTAVKFIDDIVITYEPPCTSLEMSSVTATAGNAQISLSWPSVANASSYTVTCKVKSSGSSAGTVGGVSGSETKTCTITGLSNGTEYTWSVMPVGTGSYCADNTPASGDATPNVYYTVTWKNNGSEYTTTLVANGAKPEFPSNPSSCDGTSTTFYGWSTSEWSGKLDDVSAKTIYTSGSAMPDVSGPVTYHAVFAKETSTLTPVPDTWTRITSTSQLTDGATVMLVHYSKYAINNTPGATSCTANAEITNRNAALRWIAVKSDSKWKFKTSAGKYLSTSATADNTTLSLNQTYDEWTISADAGGYSNCFNLNNGNDLEYFNSTFKLYKWSSRYSSAYPFYIYIQKTTGSTTYSQYLTTCCTSLGTINGSVNVSQLATPDPTKLKASWAMNAETGIASYTLEVYDSSNNLVKPINNYTSGSEITGLTPCTEYYVKLYTVSSGGEYCDGGLIGTSGSCTTNGYTLKVNKSNVSLNSGSEPTNICGDVSATYAASAGYTLPTSISVTNAGAENTGWTWNSSTGVLTINKASVTGNVTVTITGTAQSNFPNNKTIFIQAHSTSAWTGGGCVMAWFHSYGGSETAQPTYWLFDAGGPDEGKKLFAAIVPTTGDLPYLDIQRFAANCSDWWNKNGGCSYSDAAGSNTIRSEGSGNDQVYWNASGVTLSLYGDPNSWASSLGTFADQGAGIWTATYNNYAPANAAGETQNFKISTNYNGWIGNTGSNNNATLDDMHVGSTYNITATLDVKDHSLTMSKTFVKGTVHFDLQGHGSAISDLTNVAAGSKISAPSPAPSATGWDFGGWFKEPACTNAWNFTSDVVNETMTLYAKWTAHEYTITKTLTNVTSSPVIPSTYTYTGAAAGLNYTISPSDGYRLPTEIAVSGTTYTWNPATGALALTGTISSNVTITISAVQTHTVTWMNNGSNYGDPVVYDHGAALVLPASDPSAPSSCSGKVFVGWTSDPEITSETSTAPSFISEGGAVNADVTYRAVFADALTTFSKVTNPSTLRAGDIIAIVSNDNNYGLRVSSNAPAASASTYADAASITPAADMLWTLAGNNTTGFTFTTGSRTTSGPETLGAAFVPGNSSSTNVTLNASNNTWKFTSHNTSNCLLISPSSKSTCGLEYYSSAWKIYTKSSGIGSTEATAMRVYRKNLSGYVTTCSECMTPSDLEVSAITSTGATVTWAGVSQTQQAGGSGTGYKVAWNTSNSVPSPLNASNSADVAAGTNTYDITGLTAATQYYVFVQSKCDDSWSSSTNFYTNAKITYAAGEGSGSMDPKEVTYNTDATVDACTFTAPSGKKFNGWVSDQSVMVSASSTTSVPEGATVTGLTKAITLTAQWRDLASYTVNFSADNGTVAGGTAQTVYEEGKLTFPNVTSTTCGTFIGWVEAAYDNTAAPSGATFHAAGSQIDVVAELEGKTYYAVYRVATGMATTLTDNLVPSDFKATGTSYEATNNLVKTSSATYEAVTAKGNNAIQINKISDGRGIVSKISGGIFKGITLTTNANHSASREVYVYGSRSYTAAYADPAAFNTNSEVRGTLLATLAGDTKTYSTSTDDYKYIAIFADGAAYLDQISLTWYGAPMKYQTSPTCSPMVGVESNFSTFTYAYNAGPSASQSFTVSGSSLGADLVVTAPANYEVCKTADGTYTSTISYTPSDGAVANTTAYIRLAAGLNVGTYNYAAASGLQVTSTGAKTRTAALNGSVTKADCAITFTDFNAVDHYEATLEYGSRVTVSYNYTYNGDGNFSISRSPATGTIDKANKTLTVSTAGIWTLNASATAGTNYSKPSDASAQIRVKCVDTYKDFIHNKTIKAYGSGTAVTDGKMEDWGSGYTVPYIDDNAEETSGSCQQTHYKFMGWVSEDDINIADGTFKPGYTIVTAGTEEKRSTSKTYYAIWAKLEE